MTDFIVAGAGEGTYKSLWPALQSESPRLDMKIAAIIDVLPRESLHPQMQEIIEKEKIIYLHPDELSGDTLARGNLAGVVMTPNDSHLRYTEIFVSLGLPVYVTKPVATSREDLEKFLEISRKNPRLVYAAEPSVDGKALAFLDMAGVLDADDPRRAYLNASPNGSVLYRQLGRLISVEGKMLEGEGTAGTADHRAWLLEGRHGGMIRDLLSHLFGPLYEAGLASSSNVVNLRVKLGRYERGMPLGTWRPLKAASEGETYATIEGNFSMHFGWPAFKFEVGKYWPKHDRSLYLGFEHGRVDLSYEKPFEVSVEMGSSKAVSAVSADFYPTLALLDFQRFIDGKTGHIDRAAAIVRFNELAREAGLRQLGL